LSEEQEERIQIDMDNNGDFKESTEPVEIIREEVVEVVENPNAETSLLSSMEDQNEEDSSFIKLNSSAFLSLDNSRCSAFTYRIINSAKAILV
jgi:hypothetical protein